MRFGPVESEKVAEAVVDAERKTDAEIVTIAAPRSDFYQDVALMWATLAALLAPALMAAVPAIPRDIYGHLTDPWRTGEPPVGAVCLIVLIAAAIVFFAVRLLLLDRRVLLALTPGAVKAKRVRRRALMLYKVGAQSRTRANTAVLLYLSAAERRAEIVTDDAITARIAPDRWGEAMHAFVAEVKEGRAAEGMVAAVARIGDTLAAELPPRAPDDTNELPDRLITL